MSGVLQALLAGFGGAATDEYFEYVTMLLPGNGTNGAQNNTFLDSSTNNFTITRNGNTTQGTFTPYGSNWSNYFDGSGDYLTFPNNASMPFGTGSFTVEFWINGPLNNDKFILGGRAAIGGSLHITTGGVSGTTAGALRYVGSSTITSGSVLITDNTWHHVAIVRNGSSDITIYVDGTSVGTGTDTTNYTGTGGTWVIGANDFQFPNNVGSNQLNAYLSNLRIVKSAVYTSNFTPPTAPLTAITNTQLLTCADNRFIDDSTNNSTITVNGNPSIQRFSPFNPTTPYAAGTIGGSGYFDGSGDYLSVASSSTLAFGTGDFTIEGWYYPLAYSGDVNTITSTTTADSASVSAVNINVPTDGSMQIGNLYSTGAGTVPLMAWTYFVVSRVSGTIRLFINGVEKSSASNTTNYTSTGCLIGARLAGGQYYITAASYISGLKFIVGSGVTSVTVPSAPPTGGNVLCNFTNGGIIDNAMMNDLETVGNAQISTSVSKFGGGSMAFDGTGDWLFAPSSPQYNITSGAYTVEMWLNFTSASGTIILLGFNGKGTTGSWQLLLDSGVLYWQQRGSSSNQTSYSWSPATSTWYHLAVSWDGTTLRIFVNGTSVATNTVNPAFSTAQNGLNIGGASDGYSLNGYIDDLRITKYARYTANFTPPTQAFPTN